MTTRFRKDSRELRNKQQVYLTTQGLPSGGWGTKDESVCEATFRDTFGVGGYSSSRRIRGLRADALTPGYLP
jgi:hypothetical protein